MDANALDWVQLIIRWEQLISGTAGSARVPLRFPRPEEDEINDAPIQAMPVMRCTQRISSCTHSLRKLPGS